MTTYYVKNGGNDSASGLSDATAWATLGRVASASLGGGDAVLFKRGSRWREELIYYGGGSSDTSRLVFGAYGTGTAPIIDGSDIVTGWTTETSGGTGTGENFTDATGTRPVAWWNFPETSGNRASSGGGGNALVPGPGSPTRGTGPHGQNSVEFSKASSQYFEIPESGMSTNFPGRSTLANGNLTIGAWVRIDAETGGDAGIWSKDTNYQLIIEGSVVRFRIFGAGNSPVVDSGDAGTYSAGTWRHYTCRYTQSTGEMVLFVNGAKQTPQTIATRNVYTGPFNLGFATFKGYFDGAIAELFVSDAAMTDAQIQSIYSRGLDGSRTTSGPTLYYKAFASRPGAIFSDSTPLLWVSAKADLSPGREWWDSVNGRQYIRLSGDENPSTHTIECAVRTFPLRLQSSNWWTVEDIWVRGAKKSNIFADTNNNCLVQRCTLTHATENGIHVHTFTNLSTSGFEIRNNTCHTNGACGITIAGNYATSMADIWIHHNETYGNCWLAWWKDQNTDAYTGGIRPIGREINNVIVEDNYVHDEGNDGNLSHGCGIWFDTTGVPSICRRNRIERTTSWGVQLEDVSDGEVYSNLIVGTLFYPGIAIIRNSDDNKVYNNTLINCQGGFNISNGNGSHFLNNQFYNNIVSATSGWVLLADNGATGATAASFAKNIIGPNRTNFINVNGTQYSTLASFESAWGGGSTTSIQTNPTFTNAAAGDYHLATGSSGRSAGVAIPTGTLDFTSLAFNATTPSIGALEIVSGVTPISGTSTQRLPILRVAAAGNRSAPANTATSTTILPKLSTLAAGSRTISPRTATGLISLKALTTASLGTIGESMVRSGTSAARLPILRSAAAATRTIPARTATALIRLKAMMTAALGTVGASTERSGSVSVRLPLMTTSAAGTRLLVERTGTALMSLRAMMTAALGIVGQSNAQSGTVSVRVPSLRTSSTGTRTLVARTGTSSASLLKLRYSSSGNFTAPGQPETVPHMNAPAWRTADFGDGTTRVAWRSALDPQEKKAYTINCAQELNTLDNRIETVNIVMSGLAVLAGLRIRAMSYDRSNITLWLEINSADQTRPNWQTGEVHTLTCTIDVTDGQRFEREVSLTIRQLGQ